MTTLYIIINLILDSYTPNKSRQLFRSPLKQNGIKSKDANCFMTVY